MLWTFSNRQNDPPAYSKVSAVDDAGDDGSDASSAEISRLRRNVASLKLWMFFCSILICSLAVTLAGNLALQYRHTASEKVEPVPQMPIKPVKFEKNDLFASTASTESDQAWSSLIPAGDGLVVIEDPTKFDLPHGLSVNDQSGELYDIAAFHQLHCLQRIRDYMWHLKFAVDKNKTEQIRPILLDPQEDHIVYCFDYLRQSLMCAGDTTLEWPRQEKDGKRFAVDGWGVTHQCVDWDALLDYTKSNTYVAS